jgi:hypothetical protein
MLIFTIIMPIARTIKITKIPKWFQVPLLKKRTLTHPTAIAPTTMPYYKKTSRPIRTHRI